MLDAVDARLDGERMTEAVRNQLNPGSSHGQSFNPVVSAQPVASTQSGPLDFRAGLDPALRRLMTEAHQPSVAKPQTDCAPSLQPTNPSKSHPTMHHAGPLGHLPRITGSRWNQPE